MATKKTTTSIAILNVPIAVRRIREWAQQNNLEVFDILQLNEYTYSFAAAAIDKAGGWSATLIYENGDIFDTVTKRSFNKKTIT